MTPSTPGRPHETCPRWCTREHHRSDHPEDRQHQGDAVYVPTVLEELRRHADRLIPEEHATELIAILYRRPQEPRAWILIGEPENAGSGVRLSIDGAARLAAALQVQVAAAHAG